MDICPKCGLPKQACVCEEIAKSEQHITVDLAKRKFGKIITTVAGLKDIDMKSVARELKERLACGGTVKNNVIELQGEHKKRVKPILVSLGFSEDSIQD
jgi:translation initiation factor 1